MFDFSFSQLRLSKFYFSLVLLLFWVIVQFISQVIIITIMCYIVGYQFGSFTVIFFLLSITLRCIVGPFS